MAEWAALPKDILVLVAKRIEIFEDYFSFYAVCKSWYSVTSILGKFQALPSRFPWVMLTDKAESKFPELKGVNMDVCLFLMDQVPKHQQIEGMQNRQFYSFSASKAYEFELPEATLKKCIGVGYGLLLTIDYDLQINILNPFTRQQIGLPNILSFKQNYVYTDKLKPQEVISYFVRKVAMSSNPYNPSNGEDCIIMAIYGNLAVLGFARPGDKVWTDVGLPRIGQRSPYYQDIVYYNGKFYAVDFKGNIYVCDINDANELKATHIASGGPPEPFDTYFRYLVESSGDLLLVIRIREDEVEVEPGNDQPYEYTIGFSIFKMEKCEGDTSSDNNNPYKLTEVKNLGNNALFIGNNTSVSVPSSRCVKANSIYFCDEHVMAYSRDIYGSGHDTGIYDVESGNITLHCASKFKSHLTPPTWILS